MLGVSIIGAGTWGEAHCRTFASLGDREVRVHSICDLNVQKAELLAKKYQIPYFYSDYTDVLASDDVQAVIIATPDHLHTQIALDAAKMKKHLLVEKPLATTEEDCQKIVDAVNAHNIIAMVDFHGRWNPVLHYAKNALNNGDLGKLRYITVTLSNRTSFPLEKLKWAEKNGLLWFLGSHAVDLVIWYIGKAPESVYAIRREGLLQSEGLAAADFFLITMEFPDGIVVTLEHSWLLPKADPSIKEYMVKVVGDRASINLNLSHHRAVEFISDSVSVLPEMFAAPDVFGKSNGFVRTSLEDFILCVKTGKQPLVSTTDGLLVTKVIEKIIESANTGKKVSV